MQQLFHRAPTNTRPLRLRKLKFLYARTTTGSAGIVSMMIIIRAASSGYIIEQLLLPLHNPEAGTAAAKGENFPLASQSLPTQGFRNPTPPARLAYLRGEALCNYVVQNANENPSAPWWFGGADRKLFHSIPDLRELAENRIENTDGSYRPVPPLDSRGPEKCLTNEISVGFQANRGTECRLARLHARVAKVVVGRVEATLVAPFRANLEHSLCVF